MRAARNFALAGGGQVLGSLVLFAVNVLVARRLGPAPYGTWAFLVSLGTLVWVVLDSATSPLFLREMVRRQEETPRLWGELLGHALLLGLAGYAAFVAVVGVLKPPLVPQAAVLGLSIVFVLLSSASATVFRAQERQEFFALGFVLHKVLILGLVFVLRQRLDLWLVILVFVGADLVHFLLSTLVARLAFGLPLRLSLSWRRMRPRVVRGVPFSLAQMLRRLSFQLELLLGYQLLGASQAGIFAVAFRILQVVSQGAQIACTALFVPLVREQRKGLVSRLFLSLFVLGSLMGLANYLLAPYVVGLFGQKYAQALEVLRWFSLVFPVLFVYQIGFYYFASRDRERGWLALQGLAFLGHLGVAVWFIERYRFEGMVWGKLVNETLTLAVVLVGTVLLARRVAVEDGVPVLANRKEEGGDEPL